MEPSVIQKDCSWLLFLEMCSYVLPISRNTACNINRIYLPFVSCITMELYFKKVISKLLVCTSASKGSSAELITATKQIRHTYPPQTQNRSMQRTKSQTHKSGTESTYLKGYPSSLSCYMITQQRFCFEDWYYPKNLFSCPRGRMGCSAVMSFSVLLYPLQER